ncbi:DUF4236 domain-containing protein [Lentibacillus sp. N15]|uniref:DUF4236 domain-containing protein n=1 Tax=Lentibacillus songyuanensis TaxID=3136161 RepID=UPI0031BA325B
MGFRIKKSVKAGKGVRVNVGKSGVGLSFGTRGLRHTSHSSGRRTNSVGLPGTGLYYTKSATKKSASHPTSSRQQKSLQAQDNQWIVEEFNQYIDRITHLHKKPLQPINWKEVQALPAPFPPAEIGPQEQKALKAYQQFSPNPFQRLFKSLADKKRQQLKQTIATAKKEDAESYNSWEKQHHQASRVLDGDDDVFLEVIEQEHAFSDLAKWGDHFQFIVNDTHIPTVTFMIKADDVLPEKRLSITKTGRVSKRKMTKTDYYAIKQDYVCSCAIYAARNILALLPVDRVVVNVLEDRLNTATGHQKDTVILSVMFEQSIMDTLNLSNIDPSDAMENFDHRMDNLKTKGFRAVDRIV